MAYCPPAPPAGLGWIRSAALLTFSPKGAQGDQLPRYRAASFPRGSFSSARFWLRAALAFSKMTIPSSSPICSLSLCKIKTRALHPHRIPLAGSASLEVAKELAGGLSPPNVSGAGPSARCACSGCPRVPPSGGAARFHSHEGRRTFLKDQVPGMLLPTSLRLIMR